MNHHYDNLSMYWSRNREKFGLCYTRRLDFIRNWKYDDRTISSRDRVLYLGESLSSMAALHYNFNDGEPCPELDEAIDWTKPWTHAEQEKQNVTLPLIS